MKFYQKILAIFCLLLIFLLFFPKNNFIQTDLGALLPENRIANQAENKANDLELQTFNRNIILLFGARDFIQAKSLLEKTADLWRESGIFLRVESNFSPDIDRIRADSIKYSLATFPRKYSEMLANDAEKYISLRLAEIFNPFAPQIGNISDDLFGFSRGFTGQNAFANLQYNWEEGNLFAARDGKNWLFASAILQEKSLSAKKILQLLSETEEIAKSEEVEFLATGGAIFSAKAKIISEKESGFLSFIGITLTFFLLVYVFRSLKIFLLFLPLTIGLFVSFLLTVFIFREIHIIVLVIGSSLIGLLVDFPLHFLAATLFAENSKYPANVLMRRTVPAFLLSLLITVLGYFLLLFTPLAILRQTACFSAFALIFSFIASYFLLPKLFNNFALEDKKLLLKVDKLSLIISKIMAFIFNYRIIFILFFAIFILLGGLKSNWNDDIRNWIILSPKMLKEAEKISDISGIKQNNKRLLITANSEEKLFKIARNLEENLPKEAEIIGLHQYFRTEKEQEQIKADIRKIKNNKQIIKEIEKIGIDRVEIIPKLDDFLNLENISLAELLNNPLMEHWQNFYLGKTADKTDTYAMILQFSALFPNAKIEENIAKICHNECKILDKREQLNQLFSQTRNQALFIKILSLFLAFMALIYFTGLKRALLIIFLPSMASIITIAIFSYINLSIGLFAIFGMLLAAAIGLDYVIYAIYAKEGKKIKITAISLAAITTGISFSLLAFSGIPAVKEFGLSVALAVFMSSLFALFLANSADKLKF